MRLSSTSSSKITFCMPRNHLLPLFVSLDPKIISSGMNSANVAAFRHHWLVAHLLFPSRLASVTACVALKCLLFVSYPLIPFNQGRNDVEGFAFLEFVLKGLGCQSRGMKAYFKPGETLWKVRETDRREFLTAFLQHALECTRLWCRNNWWIWTWSQRSTRGAAGHLGFVFKYFAVFSYCGPKKWTDSPISQVSQ